MISVFGVKDGAPILAEDHLVHVDIATPMKGVCSLLYFIQMISLTRMCAAAPGSNPVLFEGSLLLVVTIEFLHLLTIFLALFFQLTRACALFRQAKSDSACTSVQISAGTLFFHSCWRQAWPRYNAGEKGHHTKNQYIDLGIPYHDIMVYH
jgi:hypothetical protein